MKEAIGTAQVFNLILIFVIVFIGLYVGAIAYTKAFKAKNRIVQIIEKYEDSKATNPELSDAAKIEIDKNLKDIGYRIVKKDCGQKHGVKGVQPSDYGYCVYLFNGDATGDKPEFSRGYYYGVKVFIHFDIPLIGNFIELPLYSETRLNYTEDRVER